MPWLQKILGKLALFHWRGFFRKVLSAPTIAPRRSVSDIIHHYESIAVADPHQKLAQCQFVVIDLETTGLNAKTDYIVSIGWVVINAQEIVLAKSRHYLIASPVSVGQSAVFHGLHDKDLKNAHDLSTILTELLTTYAGSVFVAHHAKIEQQFIAVACQRLFGKAPKLRFVDTMLLEWQRMQQQGKVLKSKDLQLISCLQRHHLPAEQQHNALEDAYSCALLLLCQLKQSRDPSLQLSDLYKMAKM